jgi:hypothetical protein
MPTIPFCCPALALALLAILAMFAHGDARAAALDQSQSARVEQSVPGDR